MDFAPPLEAKLSTISFEKLISEDWSTRANEIESLKEVCETVGFFYLKDHGVSKDLLRRLFESSRDFFKRPDDFKEKWNHDAQIFSPKTIRGYAVTGEVLNPGIDSENKQIFEFGNEKPYVPGKLFTGPNVAPSEDDVPDFTKSHMELNNLVLKRLAPYIARAFALALGLNENFFTDKLTEDDMILTQRVNYYPPYSGTCGRHTDSSLFTVLIQETQVCASSLRLFVDGQWRYVHAVEDLIVINLGNLLQYWSNYRFKSTPHYVVHSDKQSRLSIPIFVYPNADARITPLGESEDKMIISGDIYANDLNDIWNGKHGAGFWTHTCSGNKTECRCWKCM